MANIGTYVTSTETPAASSNPFNTATAFMAGVGDTGSSTQALLCHSLADVVTAIGPRSATNSTLYDAADTFFHEGGSTLYLGRVLGTGSATAQLVINDASSAAVATVSAASAGAYGNQLLVSVVNNTSTVTITLTDTYGSFVQTSPALSTKAAVVSWLNTTGYTTATAGASTNLPATLTATQLAGGANGTASFAQWQSALNTFTPGLGPGQVMAPGQSDWGTSAISGLTTALGQNALTCNRVAIIDLPDGTPASTLISDISTSYNSTGVGPIGFWAGNQVIPGVVPLTTRTVAPSPIIAALCARADAMGNPNQMAAGPKFPLIYATGPASLVSGTLETYSQADLNTLNGSGINTFANKFGVLENYGFVSSLLPTTDSIYYQFNHMRMRMRLQSDAQVLGNQFEFSQLDGQGSDILGFNTALSGLLKGYQTIGAIWNFNINTGPTVNTLANQQNGILSAVVNVQYAPGAQTVQVTLNAVPITASLPVIS